MLKELVYKESTDNVKKKKWMVDNIIYLNVCEMIKSDIYQF